jgi:plastocyanin
MNVRLRYLLIPLLFLVVPLCSAPGGGASAAPAAPPVSGGVQRVELLAGSYFFTPDRIVVRVGIPVELSVRKEKGIVPHTIEILEPALGLDVYELLGDEPTVLRFTPAKTGRYDYYCAKKLLFFKSHREKGMRGVIEVVE